MNPGLLHASQILLPLSHIPALKYFFSWTFSCSTGEAGGITFMSYIHKTQDPFVRKASRRWHYPALIPPAGFLRGSSIPKCKPRAKERMETLLGSP